MPSITPQFQTERETELDRHITVIMGTTYGRSQSLVVNTLHRESALHLLENHIKQFNSGSIVDNTNFFTEIKKVIDNGFSLYQALQHALSLYHSSPELKKQFPSLFKQSLGPSEYSPASWCLKNLYKLATGKELTDEQMTQIIESVELPERSDEQQNNYIKACVRTLIQNPIQFPDTLFKQKVLKKYLILTKEKEDVALQAEEKTAAAQRKAEAAYQQKILTKAIDLLRQLPHEELCFDPQGHIMVEVPPLTQAELNEISTDPEILKALDVDLSKNTLCSVDTKCIPDLKRLFIAWITADDASDELKRAINALIDSESVSSIISLQKAMTFHIMLAMRVFQAKIEDEEADPKVWQTILAETLCQSNKLVQQEYLQALKASLQNNAIDIKILNKELDKARAVLAPKCRDFLVDTCYKYFPNRDKLNQAFARLKDKDFKTTTASDKDYLRSDTTNGIVTRVTRTTKTAHGKAYGADEQAFRCVHTSRYTVQGIVEGIVEAIDRPMHAVARVPSIAQLTPDKKKSSKIIAVFKKMFKALTHQESVDDVAKKLAKNYARLQTQLGGNYAGPMIYNLLTSLHSKFYDLLPWERKNAQRASAARILKGAHLFNSRQIEAGKPNSLCYVQNIAVNQHTNDLSYRAFDNATREATLMADIALLSTFVQNAQYFNDDLSKKLRNDYFEIHQAYKLFLTTYDQGDIYFHETELGEMVMEKLDSLKEQLATENLQSKALEDTPSKMVELATQTLLKLYANNTHWNAQYGMLTQALSVFIERACQVGCKSASERLESLMGRVLLLESLNAHPEKENPMIAAFEAFITNNDPTALQQALDTCYSQRALYMQEFSSNDSGGESKVDASKSGIGKIKEWWNTNIAESGVVTWLSQKFTSQMQAHKMKPAQTYQKLARKKADQYKDTNPQTLPAAVTTASSAETSSDRAAGETPYQQFRPLFDGETFEKIHKTLKPLRTTEEPEWQNIKAPHM